MRLKLLLSAWFLSSAVYAGSISCTLGSVTQTTATSCLVRSTGNTGLALGRLFNSIAGNVFTLSDTSVVEHSPVSGPASVTFNDFVALPATSPLDTYMLSLSIGAPTTSSISIQLGLAGSYGSDPACSLSLGCVYNLSLSASQIPAVTVQSSVTNLNGSSTLNTYANLSISQFGPDGQPLAFSLTPEPSSLVLVGLASLALMMLRSTGRAADV